MSNSIATLLLRNLSDVFGENDPVCRRAAIDEIFFFSALVFSLASVMALSICAFRALSSVLSVLKISS